MNYQSARNLAQVVSPAYRRLFLISVRKTITAAAAAIKALLRRKKDLWG